MAKVIKNPTSGNCLQLPLVENNPPYSISGSIGQLLPGEYVVFPRDAETSIIRVQAVRASRRTGWIYSVNKTQDGCRVLCLEGKKEEQ